MYINYIESNRNLVVYKTKLIQFDNITEISKQCGRIAAQGNWERFGLSGSAAVPINNPRDYR